MSSLNRAYIAGNLVHDPEAITLPTNVPLTEMMIAIETGQAKTTFIQVKVWNLQATWCAQNLKKGDRVTVEGSIDSSTWTDDQGSKRTKHFIVADRVCFLSRKREPKDARETQD